MGGSTVSRYTLSSRLGPDSHGHHGQTRGVNVRGWNVSPCKLHHEGLAGSVIHALSWMKQKEGQRTSGESCWSYAP